MCGRERGQSSTNESGWECELAEWALPQNVEEVEAENGEGEHQRELHQEAHQHGLSLPEAEHKEGNGDKKEELGTGPDVSSEGKQEDDKHDEQQRLRNVHLGHVVPLGEVAQQEHDDSGEKYPVFV